MTGYDQPPPHQPRAERDDFAVAGPEAPEQKHHDISPPPAWRAHTLSPEFLARRRAVVRWLKWALPALAVVFLILIALWPQFEHILNSTRATADEFKNIHAESGIMMEPVYRGLDEHLRPFTLTAQKARQVTPEQVNLTLPKADILTGNGEWLMVRSDTGVYMQHEQLLDLSHHVTLYRDDGLIMHSPTAGISTKEGIIASDSWVHAEGPFGVLDAQGYVLDHGNGIAQFTGPSRMILNDDEKAKAAPPQALPKDPPGNSTP